MLMRLYKFFILKMVPFDVAMIQTRFHLRKWQWHSCSMPSANLRTTLIVSSISRNVLKVGSNTLR